MNVFARIALRKDDAGKLALVGYYDNGRMVEALLFSVTILPGGEIALKGGVAQWGVMEFPSWARVSQFLLENYGIPLYGMDMADRKVMDFFAERERMMDHATKEYAFPKGERKGFPPSGVTERAVKEVESFRDWKARQDHWRSMQEKDVASPS